MSKGSKKKTSPAENRKFPLPIYRKEDDIYNQEREDHLDDEDSIRMRIGNEDRGMGTDLDIPGVELDDLNEVIGEEDEENNYYSFGGDDHNDLEEDNS